MRVPRWLRLALVSIGAVVTLALLGLYGGSAYILKRHYPITDTPIVVPTDSLALAEGQHLVQLRGCLGCHGAQAEGKVFYDEPGVATVVAPNLTRAVANYSAGELDGIIRHAVRPNGQSVLGMPSEAFTRLRDEDLARIIAFIRSLPPVDGPGPSVSVGPLGRLGLITGKFKTGATLVDAVTAMPALPDSIAEGSYLAHTICAECHGSNLEGDPGFAVPSLAIASIYSLPEFETLMRTGKARGDRELGLMSEVARSRFVHFTPAELEALFRYLHSPPPKGASGT